MKIFFLFLLVFVIHKTNADTDENIERAREEAKKLGEKARSFLESLRGELNYEDLLNDLSIYLCDQSGNKERSKFFEDNEKPNPCIVLDDTPNGHCEIESCYW